MAELLYKRALATNEKALGLEHPDAATSLNNLPGIYQCQGSHDKAEHLYSKNSEQSGLYKKQGKYDKAEPLYESVLAIAEKMLGSKHPNTATTLNNLLQGSEKAELLYKRALEIQKKIFGPEHPGTAATLNNMNGC
ncbi:TPR repeat protein [Jimgerdemannia flammicorona]|uniref:TPR repeat protein n=1 Tax=Jimgerdemannia flammicorona TaxID=994334 RepID=A0A433CW49_9FUNG|nr:TPR repeat protein [Jimgerdemannia flammicorona]